MPLRCAILIATALATPACGSSVEAGHDAAPPLTKPKIQSPSQGAWLKGQLHLHSDASGDSDTPAADVVRWYAEHDYDFIVFTDHNRVTSGPSTEGMLVLPGVELTQNLPRCTPPSARGDQCLLHVNALVVEADLAERANTLPIPTSGDRIEHYTYAMKATTMMGGIAQLNHPNFHYAADAEQIAALVERGLSLFEVANEAWDSNNDGDTTHPSTTEIWDRVLSQGGHLYGTATDDAHHYQDAARRRANNKPVFVGDRGFVMVRAAREPAAIRAALADGDFYASTGVYLAHVAFEGGVLEVRVAEGTDDGPHTITFVADGGTIVQSSQGPAARFDTTAGDSRYSYVRALVTNRQGQHAWVQPVFLDRTP